jgi:hypothetical protein
MAERVPQVFQLSYLHPVACRYQPTDLLLIPLDSPATYVGPTFNSRVVAGGPVSISDTLYSSFRNQRCEGERTISHRHPEYIGRSTPVRILVHRLLKYLILSILIACRET